MAATPNITELLAALARNATPSQPQSGTPQGAPGYLPAPSNTGSYPSFQLPQPTNSGSLDLSGVRPVNSGTYDGGRGASGDPRLAGRSYRRSRSRSRSPPRRDQFRDNYNPYRDERRGGGGGRDYGRSRSRSPQRGSRSTFSPQRNVSGRDRSDGATEGESEIILIDSNLVGLVIGRGGENMKRIEQDSGARIQFVTGPDSGAPQRQCRITGTSRARMDAKREINRIISENNGNPIRELGTGGGDPRAGRGPPQVQPYAQPQSQAQKDGSNHPALREGENSVQIMVPDRTVGLIIGRGGETIRDLQDKSGCHINIVGTDKSISGMRPVNLIGSHDAAQRAKDLILEIVESDTRGPGAPPPTNSRDNYGGFQAAPAGGSSDKINETIRVPSDAVGMIIGKGGETIKDMQNMTGCKINVTQPQQPDIERDIGLIGTRQAIDAAKQAIWDKVDSVRSRDRSRNDGPSGGYGSGGPSQYSQQQQPSYAPPPQQAAAPAAAPPAAGQAGGAADPYAAYGGYQAYVTAWYNMIAQQQQQQGAQAPGSAPPGT